MYWIWSFSLLSQTPFVKKECFLHLPDTAEEAERKHDALLCFAKMILFSRSHSSSLLWMQLFLTTPAPIHYSFVQTPTLCMCVRSFRMLYYSLSNSSASVCLPTQIVKLLKASLVFLSVHPAATVTPATEQHMIQGWRVRWPLWFLFKVEGLNFSSNSGCGLWSGM